MTTATITRSVAKQLGLTHYYTGKPCKYGHTDKRYTTTGQCKSCILAHSGRWREENVEKVKAGQKRWRDAQPKPEKVKRKREPRSLTHRRYRLKKAGFPNANLNVICLPWPDEKTRWNVYSHVKRQEIAAGQKRYREQRQDYLKQRWKEYYESNKATMIEKAAMRRLALIQATPIWLTDDQRREISLIYAKSGALSIETGVPHHVDHIVPLRGKHVCGLHVPWNLAPLPWLDNLTKSNTHST